MVVLPLYSHREHNAPGHSYSTHEHHNNGSPLEHISSRLGAQLTEYNADKQHGRQGAYAKRQHKQPTGHRIACRGGGDGDGERKGAGHQSVYHAGHGGTRYRSLGACLGEPVAQQISWKYAEREMPGEQF